jgi:TM2 domain-containing membrane protein YozV
MVAVVFMLCCCLVELLLAILIVVLALFFNFLWVSMGMSKKIGGQDNVKFGIDMV